ncbi:hypothetical protein BDZ97DRAFT_1754373 [Flammula alnicola]|nr:hypothetical protein BDZ97DRAFT_1754373 [Flammula alnicola]
MSEQQPLLPAHNLPPPGDESLCHESTYEKCRNKTAYFLEHRTLHKIVIALIAIDAACVLADLSYSFLSPTCSPPGGEDSPEWLEVLSYISLAITTLFLVEIPLTLWALGPQYMNPFGPVPHAALHLFDSVIILTTFVLEAVLRGKEAELAGLLVILRLWRLVKLVGGVAVGTSEVEEENAELLADARPAEAQEENARLKAQFGQ